MSNEREIEALAYDLGAKGSPAIEQDRLAFEAWMRGHAWALGAMWNGKEYTNDAEQGGYVCPYALRIRMIWAAWRDRGELARRLQPARVPEGWSEDRLRAEAKARGWYTREGTSVPTPDGDWRHPFEVTIPSRDLCALLAAAPAAEGGMVEPVAWQRQTSANGSDWTDWQHHDAAERPAVIWTPATLGSSAQPHIARYRPLGVMDSPAPESREADASTAFEGWSAAINAATELETNAPDERYRVRANAVRRWIEKRKPEAGQREGITDALMWLRGALDCPSFAWDADQREAAEVALASAQQAVKQERTGSRGEGE